MSYEQKVIWLGTILGEATEQEFENYFLEDLGFNVKFEEEIILQEGDLENHHCIIFSICTKDIPKFSLFRITTNDMKWWEDFCDNYGVENIPTELINKYGGN